VSREEYLMMKVFTKFEVGMTVHSLVIAADTLRDLVSLTF